MCSVAVAVLVLVSPCCSVCVHLSSVVAELWLSAATNTPAAAAAGPSSGHTTHSDLTQACSCPSQWMTCWPHMASIDTGHSQWWGVIIWAVEWPCIHRTPISQWWVVIQLGQCAPWSWPQTVGLTEYESTSMCNVHSQRAVGCWTLGMRILLKTFQAKI